MEPQIPATFFPRLCARPSSERLDLTSAHLETKKLRPRKKSRVAWPGSQTEAEGEAGLEPSSAGD